MDDDITEAELDRELARMAGRTLPPAQVQIGEADDLTLDELDVALARLTGRAVPAQLAERAAADAHAREARESAAAKRPTLGDLDHAERMRAVRAREAREVSAAKPRTPSPAAQARLAGYQRQLDEAARREPTRRDVQESAGRVIKR